MLAKPGKRYSLYGQLQANNYTDVNICYIYYDVTSNPAGVCYLFICTPACIYLYTYPCMWFDWFALLCRLMNSRIILIFEHLSIHIVYHYNNIFIPKKTLLNQSS